MTAFLMISSFHGSTCLLTALWQLQAQYSMNTKAYLRTSPSKFSVEFGKTTAFLGDFDPETGAQVSDVPLAMESPVKRPVPTTRWKTMARDSLRPDPPTTVLAPSGLHRGWVRMAAGRPPHQSWKRQVWLFLSVRHQLSTLAHA